jgi:DNA processing protein
VDYSEIMDVFPDPVPDTEELKYWLALLRAPDLGSRGLAALTGRCDSLRELFLCSPKQLTTLGIRRRTAHYLLSPPWQEIDRDLEWLQQPGNHLVTLRDPRYPTLLKEIHDPPPLLFIHGDPRLLNLPQMAIVGSRNPTPSGKETARDFAAHLVAAGLTITSGLAIGIDGAAHQGALAAAGTTLAVTGTGLDRVYPARQRELAHRIAEQGALVSELPLGTPPLAGNFPRRNRIISGLSVGTLVVEAARKSGSLITARMAAEQGREVFAVPGSIHNPLARGCHALIRLGAKLVETGGDVLEELAPLLGTLPMARETPHSSNENNDSVPDREHFSLLQSMGFDPVTPDQLIERSGLTADVVSSMLLLLELEGYVSSAPGGLYCRRGNADPTPPSQVPVNEGGGEACHKDPT